MAIAGLELKEDSFDAVPLHFATRSHYLALDDFIKTTKSVELVATTLCKNFFPDVIDLEIRILPSETGSFKQTLKIVAKAAKITVGIAAAVFAFMNSDVGKAYIKGLTGHEPSYWAEEIGKEHLAFIHSVQPTEKANEEHASLIAAALIAECSKSFLQKDASELKKIGLLAERYEPAYRARNTFYKTCINNPKISAVEFSYDNKFPIKRSDFEKFIIDISKEEEFNPKSKWHHETFHLTVTSPNWIREGRQWKAKLADGKIVWFAIEDDLFWGKVETRNIQPQIFDNMKIQAAYLLEDNQKKFVRALRVLEYNGAKISTKLRGDELDKALTNFVMTDIPDQPDLFD